MLYNKTPQPTQAVDLSVKSHLDIDLHNKYKIFFILWAIATLFHMAHFKIFDDKLHYFLLSIAAVALIAKPSSISRMVIFISLQLYEALSRLPIISNHWIFTAFVNLTILHALFFLIFKNKSLNIDRGELLKTFAPVVRIELLILYFYVVFHKLNSSFFTPTASCASDFYMAQNSYLILPTTLEVLSLNAYLTVIVEALIPILIIFRKTRYWGIFIGLAFHCVIAFNPIRGFYDFSSMIFALYFLFTDSSFSNKLIGAWNSLNLKLIQIKRKFIRFKIKNLLMIIAVFLVGFYILNKLIYAFDDFFRHVFWSIYSFAFITIFLISLFYDSDKSVGKKSIFSIPHYSFILFPVIIFINGLSPYLGLKTEYSFAMFSNLRTENGISNHFLIPSDWQIFNFQKDMVEIIASSDPDLQFLADHKKLMVYFKFRDYVALLKPEKVDYLRNGEKHTFLLSDASSNKELLQPNIYLWRKFLDFRNINKFAPQPCTH